MFQNYFKEESKAWGWYLEFDSAFYIVDKQRVNADTAISGQYWYLTPTLFFRHATENDWVFIGGLGYGIGYLSVSGDMVMTGKPGQPLESFNTSKFGESVGVIAEISKYNWVLQYKGFAPVIEVRDNSLDLSNHRIIFGKRFNF